ncbi:MAG: hypothetical protein P8182_14625, partial [Deltaproteobacteria bacterium]
MTAEVYRMKRQRRGLIVGMNDAGMGLVTLPVVTVHVRLDDGNEVQAKLNCCTACLGRLSLGDEVRVSDTRDGWVVNLPWLRTGACSAGSSRNDDAQSKVL